MNNPLEQRKYPVGVKKYVGIELEFLINRKDNTTLEKLLTKENLQWNIHLGSDGSIQDLDFIPKYKETPYTDSMGRIQFWKNLCNDHERMIGKEIRILAEQSEMNTIVTKVCNVLKTIRAKVNKTCGLHVHLDMRNRNMEKAFTNLYSNQNILFKSQPKDRRKNKYCKKIPNKKSRPSTRFYGINKIAYREHRTIEIRTHEGTINAKDIILWTKYLINLCDGKKIPKLAKGYIDERIKKYS